VDEEDADERFGVVEGFWLDLVLEEAARRERKSCVRFGFSKAGTGPFPWESNRWPERIKEDSSETVCALLFTSLSFFTPFFESPAFTSDLCEDGRVLILLIQTKT
jgi:hypothetical protein